MEGAAFFILISFILGLFTAVFYIVRINSISVSAGLDNELHSRSSYGAVSVGGNVMKKMLDIADAIEQGAGAFLFAEYGVISAFIVIFAVLIGVLLPEDSWAASGSFVWGAVTSLVCGYIGMKIAVKANVRTAKEALYGIASSSSSEEEHGHGHGHGGGHGHSHGGNDDDHADGGLLRDLSEGYSRAFNAAFFGGAVMGFALVSLGVCNLFILIFVMEKIFPDEADRVRMYEAIAGYGLGGSTVALFGRVGGGIYTKAADVGADLVGKVEQDIPEDDPRNPAVIADNVGDNVGDIAGMGADLFGSFAESTCAAMVIAASAQSAEGPLGADGNARWFPLAISAVGILVCMVTSILPQVFRVRKEEDIERQLKLQLIVSTILATPLVWFISSIFLPDQFVVVGTLTTNTNVFICVAIGLWSGLIIGIITEFYTSHSYRPVREVADACTFGASTNIIYGLALGYQSCIIPVLCLGVTICTGYRLANQYGIAMGALGMLTTLCIGLTIDGYGPISDNAGGIAEMAGLPEDVRQITDALDAAGNTTAAIGKGFAIGSAALVSLALFGAFTVRSNICNDTTCSVDILKPLTFTGLIIGAMLPYAFSALTMKSVGFAAQKMVEEVRRQFREDRARGGPIMAGRELPDYRRCVSISTTASLREMILPGAMVIVTPLLTGYVLGKHALAGLLAGAIVSGVQIAISAANTGGAWDNAKKFVEKGNLGGKGSDAHKAAVVGDTVGDPLKDTSGPSLNILIKLMAILSLVFAGFIDKSGGVLGKKIDACSFEVNGCPPLNVTLALSS